LSKPGYLEKVRLTRLCFKLLDLLGQEGATLDQSIKDWERAKAYTQEYLFAMPFV
jgi:hypothetical protein